MRTPPNPMWQRWYDRRTPADAPDGLYADQRVTWANGWNAAVEAYNAEYDAHLINEGLHEQSGLVRYVLSVKWNDGWHNRAAYKTFTQAILNADPITACHVKIWRYAGSWADAEVVWEREAK